MKVIIEIPEKEVKIELDDAVLSVYNVTREISNGEYPVKLKVGLPIIVLTCNLPIQIREMIEKQIENIANYN